jgi:hypothetical protein
VTLEGTDFSPGPGPSKTTLTGVLTWPEADQTNGENLAYYEGVLEGGVVLKDGNGNVTDDCHWEGDFVGTVVFVAPSE